MQTLPRLCNISPRGKLQPSITKHDHQEMSLFSALASRVLDLTLLPTLSWCPVPGKPIWRRKTGVGKQEAGGVPSSVRGEEYLSPKTLSLWASALFWLWLTWDFPGLGSDWGTGLLALVQEHEALPEKIHLCIGPRGPGQPGLLSRGRDGCCDGAGFPTAFGVRVELGNSRPSELQMAYLASLGSLAELA